MFLDLPEKFTRLMTEAHGAAGAKWLAALPIIVEEIEREWSIKVAAPFANLSYHFVAPCVCANGEEAVLKIGFPEKNSPICNEAAMLKIYGGAGAARLQRLDEKRFALLLEKLTPGETLLTVCQNNAARAVEIYIEALRKIIRQPPATHNFIRLDEWFANSEKALRTDFPKEAINKTLSIYGELSAAEKFLLHGDFHHENILSARRDSFLAIDPKGIVGQLGYEISVFLNNHLWWLEGDPARREKLNQAVAEISQAFEIPALVLRRWAYAQAVLSAWWTFEENGKNWERELAFAEFWETGADSPGAKRIYFLT